MHFLSAALLVLTAVLPPVSTKRPKTARLSRGAVWTSFEAIELKKGQIETAQQALLGYRRVAVVAKPSADLVGEQHSAGTAGIYALLLGQKLNYGTNILPLDFVSTAQLFEDSNSLEKAIETARANKLDILVWCELQDVGLTITVVKIADLVTQQQLATVAIGDKLQSTIPATREKLYAALEISVPADQLQQLPSQNLSALGKWMEAYSAAARIIRAEDEQAQLLLCEKVVQLSSEALAIDAGLVEAYLLKASCLDELGDVGGVMQTLRDGFARRDPKSIDPLTNFELEADYARFSTKNIDKALAGYLQILEADPQNLRGAWGLIDILLEGDGKSKPQTEDIAEAANLATMIIAAHPQSAVARVIADQIK